MSVIAELLKTLLGVWGEMLGGALEVAPKAIMFVLWVLSAFIILPCVFVAGTLYPIWTEWGEGF